ncbi:MAG: hypothetical protein L6Q95_12540 [Planctomycetes bacterium]|nr:hypothetical protein [Planctomycetota bacterium]
MRVRECALLLALLAACGGKDAPKDGHGGHDHEAGEEHAHAHGEAPHGGEILDLGNGAAHLEIIHDHDGGNMTVYVLGADMKTLIAVEKPAVNIMTTGGPATVDLTPVEPGADGKAACWKGSHEGLKADPWDGRIRVTIDGKTYQSPLEGEAHDHR